MLQVFELMLRAGYLSQPEILGWLHGLEHVATTMERDPPVCLPSHTDVSAMIVQLQAADTLPASRRKVSVAISTRRHT